MTIIYIRTSTTEQNPELQLRDIATMVDIEATKILKEHQSAFKEHAQRPELEELKKLILKRRVSKIYVWHLDRIYRNRKNLISFLQLCKTYGVSIFSFNQLWLQSIQTMPSPFNEIVFDLMCQIIGMTSEDESQTKSNRVKLAVRKVAGETVSYKGNRWGRKPLSTQTTNKVIALHQEGHSLREIANAVTIYDKNNNSRLISKSAVHKILSDFKLQKDS